jgi:hypothetical protein
MKVIHDVFLGNIKDKFPNRHKEIHKECCEKCPSKHGEDPEVKDIKETCGKEVIVKEFLFVCAWRPNKLCKGY